MGKLFKIEKGKKNTNPLALNKFNAILYLWVSDPSVYNEAPLSYIMQS